VIAYDVLEEADSLEAATEDDVGALDDTVGVASALDKDTEEEAEPVDPADEVAFAGEEGATEDPITFEDDSGAEDVAGVSAGAVSDGKTVVYCVTMTTGGTGNEVDGRSSADADEGTVEETGTAGIAAPAELETTGEGAVTLATALDDNATLAEDRTPDAAAVGKTVVYSVFVTTRPDDMVIVEFAGGRSAELEAGIEDAAELTGADEPVADKLNNALLRVAEPGAAPGWVKPGIPVPFCAGWPPTNDEVALTIAELEVIELSREELRATELVGVEVGVMVLGAEKASVVVVSSGE
jgi:hypothetical protein